LLEYHQGILFLTTNRVKRFDEAFHSRISIALKYEDLGQMARKQVWTNFFDIAGITSLDAEVLSRYPLNGRQIRNTIRLAQALAKSEGTSISMKHVERTVQVASQFQDDLASDAESKWWPSTEVLQSLSIGAITALSMLAMRYLKL
jgi:hypothetical protein